MIVAASLHLSLIVTSLPFLANILDTFIKNAFSHAVIVISLKKS